MISVIIPVYNEGNPLISFCHEIISYLDKIGMPYELVLIDDCSQDDSWNVMKGLAKDNKKIKVARLIRNFGQHSALTTGLTLCKGDFAILMDCDGQDDPVYIHQMLELQNSSGAEIVYCKRMNRQSSKASILSSYLVNKLMEVLSGIRHDPQIGTFRLITRKVINAYLSLPEKRRYLGSLFYWLGFTYVAIEVQHRIRTHGKSNYNIKKLLQLARLGILSSSTNILSMGTYLGIFSSCLTMFLGLYFIIQKLIYNVPIGFTAIVVSIFFVGSIIIFLLGIIGEYIGEIFHEVKGRPNYLICESINFENEKH